MYYIGLFQSKLFKLPNRKSIMNGLHAYEVSAAVKTVSAVASVI